MDYISKIAEVLKSYMPGDTVLVVSSMDEGRRILKACAEKVGFLVGVRILTPAGIAQEICGKLLGRPEAPKMLGNGADKDIIFQCLKSMPEEGFFSLEHAYDRKTAELMLEVINELESSCVYNIEGNVRLDAVEKVRQNYKAAKKNANVIDRYDLLNMGIVEAAGSEVFADTNFVMLGNSCFSTLESNFMGAFRKKNVEIIKLDYPKDTALPKGILADGLSEKEIERSGIEFYRCRSIETEQRFIMRDILEKGYRLEDCAVVYLTADYAKGLKEAAAFYNLPISVSGGVPFTGSMIYHMYKGLAVWAGSDFNAEKLRELIMNGALYFFKGRSFCKWMRKVNVGWGYERYLELLDKALAKQDITEEDKECFAAWKEHILTLFAALDTSSDMESQKAALGKLLLKKNISEPDAYALAKSLLAGLIYLDEGETVLGRLLDAMEETSYQSGGEGPGKIFCVPLRKAFCTGRKVLYICGMSRFSMQGGKAESPLILDSEKKEWELETSLDREAANNFRLKLLLLGHDGRICISYNDFNPEKMIELQPAPLLRDLAGDKEIKSVSYIFEGDEYTLGDVICKGTPISLVTEDAQAILGTEKAELKDAKDYVDQFNSRELSASSLEMALECPLKFYLNKIIGLNPVQLPESTEDAWLSAAEMGTLCHKVLERYYKASAADYTGILDEEIESLKETRPLARESAMLKDKDSACAIIENAIAWTKENNHKVVDTELAFGKNAEKEEDKAPLELTIGTETIRLNGSIDRIDRLEDGQLAVVDYKTGSPAKYKDNIDKKLQPYLYTLAAEKIKAKAGVRITEAGYLFLRGYAEYLPDNQSDDARKVKERTIVDLLHWMRDEKQAQVACPSFIIDDKGAIVGFGDAEAAEEAYKECSKYCDFKDYCEALRKTVVRSEGEN